MKHSLYITVLLSSLLFCNVNLFAKCYSFRKSENIKVCINGDSNADRRKALSICMNKTGMDCGGVGGYTDSCIKDKKTKCYNEEGKEQDHISVD